MNVYTGRLMYLFAVYVNEYECDIHVMMQVINQQSNFSVINYSISLKNLYEISHGREKILLSFQEIICHGPYECLYVAHNG